MAGKKRLTNREKRINAQVKKELQDKGIIPPDKPRLNRKMFIEEAMKAWNDRDKECLIWESFLMKAFSYMLGHHQRGKKLGPSLEAVGAAKVLMIALRLWEFHKGLKEQGLHEYKGGDQYNFVKDILDA